jgi:hypothetical protein
MPSALEYGNKVISEFDVELLPEVTGMSPEQGGILGLFAIAFRISSEVGRTQEITERSLEGFLPPKVNSKIS